MAVVIPDLPEISDVAICEPYSLPGDIEDFGFKIQQMAGGLGNNCAVIDSATNFFTSGSSELSATIKQAINDALDLVSAMWDSLNEFTGGLLQGAADAITGAIALAISVLDTITSAISQLMQAIRMVADRIKTALCGAANTALKSLPGPLVAGVAGAAAVIDADLSSITNPVERIANLDLLANELIVEAGILDIRDNITENKTDAELILDYIEQLKQFRCNI